MHRKTILSNDLRIVTQKLEHLKSITVLILVGAGSRYEVKEQNGISHFLEHMFFKGAKKYNTNKDVSEAIDQVGGEFNAFTAKEYAGYYVKVANQHANTAYGVLSDMLLFSKLREEDINKEKKVILEEYNMYQDTPIYQIGWNFEKLVFGDQPLGWDQIGTKDFIENVNRDELVNYHRDLYTPDNIVISVTGNIEHNEIVKIIEDKFIFEDRSKAYEFKEYKKPVINSPIHIQRRKTEQSHVILGFESFCITDPDYYALKVLSVILGGNMSSRMFLNVRADKGLAYSISTTTDDYVNTGTLSTRAGVDIKKTDQAITAMIEEYKKVREELVPGKEVNKAKEYIKGKLVLHLEDSEEYAHMLSKDWLILNQIRNINDIFKAIDKVNPEDVLKVAKRVIQENELRLALIGPFEDKEKFQELLKF